MYIQNLTEAVTTIKSAILKSRYIAARLANAEMLKLYLAIGKYISQNTRINKWGTGALQAISDQLQKELPGLRGFSEGNLKKMRIFYEEWSQYDLSPQNRALLTHDLKTLPINVETFFMIGFTHHYEIIKKCEKIEDRIFYINNCARNFWSVENLQNHIAAQDHLHVGALPNNFAETIPDDAQASRAIFAFKDEMLLDFVNIEDENDECADERVLERGIVNNVKTFIQKLGSDFCFVDSQHRIVESDEEFFVDLLFYNRTLQSLVAIELKKGKFKPAYLGQLNFYLSLLDKYERKPGEKPSIGIILCKEAKKNIVELAIRDFSKPMGVSTYRLASEIPEHYAALKPIAESADQLLS
ncbi:MAG: PDDEXK nuclease domain-containing protein [Fibrobacter sp.]|nr:PDDEXK nuclease domain-containing protein [Fibrobacter sp.]